MKIASVALAVWLALSTASQAQSMLENQLLAEDAAALAQDARKFGDPARGAIVFYQPYLACTKCHLGGQDTTPLGPDLAKAGKEATDVYIVESILNPSKKIKKGYETATILTGEGKTITGLVVKDDKKTLTLRDAANVDKMITIASDDIEQRSVGKTSLMPKGLTNALASRQQFLDLARYLMEIAEGGPQRALALRPAPSLYAARPLPEYEKKIDHMGMISTLNRDSFKRGEAIYNRLCINCHGTKDQPGSLPTSLKFASGKFKNGADPYTMYQTLTRGFGMMVPQTWMVPEQKYDVIHYIREAYLKPHNPNQLFPITVDYLKSLPKGDTRGPKPSKTQPWSQMDYGPNLTHTYEIPGGPLNFAYKGIATRLDSGPGGVSRGRYWSIFDHDTMRVAAGWSGEGFIDYNGIMFNGRHAIHPKVTGQVHFANPIGPGWANPETGDFEDVRLRGRDNRIYGPLPRKWAHYKGLYTYGDRIVVKYTVGKTEVLEMPGMTMTDGTPVFTRTFNIGPRDKELILQIAHRADSKLNVLKGDRSAWHVALFGQDLPDGKVTVAEPKPKSSEALKFNGGTRVEVDKSKDLDMNRDYTVTARIKTKSDGTIFCKTIPRGEWVRDGKTLFVRGGRLCFDVGWVGAVQTRRRIADGKWHDVALVQSKNGDVKLYVDGKVEGQGRLKAEGGDARHRVRIGYTSTNFPTKNSFFKGEIVDVKFYGKTLGEKELAQPTTEKLLAHWKLTGAKDDVIADAVKNRHPGKALRGKPTATATAKVGGALATGVSADLVNAGWSSELGWLTDGDNLRLKIPSGATPLKFVLWTAAIDNAEQAKSLMTGVNLKKSELDLAAFTKGGPARWPAELKTVGTLGKDDGPFAVDVLKRPTNNPWFCRMRFGGFDFTPDGKTMIIGDWDGDVWRVTGVEQPEKGMTWRRIASGLFQVLGVKIVDGKIYCTCRDQLAILHDLNGDGETDYYESFNNDHQVTEHFHEFAMGLQVDDKGNFYYAKSARHAKTALVPHHGTLLRISSDGKRTDILANGFRAANGVCLNPDGSFIVTDQEGHWNPKNRINWVREGGFYGNMFGYHDVKDSSDSAMEQPLCWITNAFDRSPAELLWVDEKKAKWGPLNGSLLNLSYGYGKVYVVPHEEVNGQMQGGMCQLPIPQFPTGVMRGRFHPNDGQLYCCGLFAWAGTQHQPGGLYRVRYTGKPANLPVDLSATKKGIEITFSDEINPSPATDPSNYAIKTWSLKRTASYGSRHYNERPLKVTSATVSDDNHSVLLEVEGLQPTWCMEIRYSLKDAFGKGFNGTIHNTIHNLDK